MNAVEQALGQALQSDPANWDLRLELIEKLAARGAQDEVTALIEQAPAAPADETRLGKLVETCAAAHQLPAVEALLTAFVTAKPSSAVGHYLVAKINGKTGNLDKAREHYQTAVALNSDLEDGVLAAKLTDLGQTIPHSQAEVARVVAEVAAAPAAPQQPEPQTPAPPPEAAPAAAQTTPPAPAPPAQPAVPAPAPLVAPPEAVAPPVPSSTSHAIPLVTGDVPPPVALVAEEPHPAPLAVEAAHDPAPVAYSEPVEPHAHLVHEGEADMVEYDVSMTETRRIILGGGDSEPPPAVMEVNNNRSKVTSIAIAFLVHLAILAGFALVVMSIPQPNPPQIVASASPVLDDNTMQKQEIKKQVQRKPVESAQNQMEVISVAGASSVSMPDITTDLMSFEPLGVGDAFGSSMTFDAGEDGGMVSFFGAKSTSKRVVFAVDYSASMKSQGKDALMRKELAKSVNALPGGIEYQLIFFHGPAWYHEQSVDFKGDRKEKFKNYYVLADRGNDKWKWFMGDNEDKRTTGKFNALFHPDWGLDPEDLPRGKYWSSTRSNIRKSLKIIEETPLGAGTDWRWPLYMAINMEPDTIYFMTDGAFGIPNKDKVIDAFIAYSRKKGRPKINTINMMVLNPGTEALMERLAKETRGEFSLVLADQTVLRGRDLEDFRKKRK